MDEPAPDAGEVVRSFFEHMQARDWQAAASLLATDASINFSATGEQFTGASFMAMNEAYPEGWEIEVVETIAAGQRVAVQVIVDHGVDRFWCAGFYTVESEKITVGTEHWVTEGAEEAPSWREKYWR